MTVERNDQTKRFELSADEHTAFIDFDQQGDLLELIHTEVPDELGGRGIGTELVKGALAHARENGLRVKATCAFVRGYLERHADERDIVDE